jgi:Tfp pilus assembly protein PilV
MTLVLVGLGVLAVGGVAYYAYQQNQAALNKQANAQLNDLTTSSSSGNEDAVEDENDEI